MTRVLFLTNLYPPHHYGGYELLCRDVAQGLRDRGHDVLVLTTSYRVAGVTDPPGEQDVRRELAFYWDDHVFLRPWLPRRLAIERRNQAALERALAWRPDVVSVWHMGAMSLGLLATIAERKVPMVLNLGDDWLVYGPQADAWSRMFVERPRLAAVAHRLTGLPTGPPDLSDVAACFCSGYTKSEVEQRGRWRFRRGGVVWCGVDTRDFSPDPAGSARPWSWRLLCVGRVDSRKGVDTAVRALALLPDEATLDIVGRGDAAHEAQLRSLVAELRLDDRVRFDVTDRAGLVGRYRDADVFVFPVNWAEPFGLVPLEAMACGTPVVATGTGGSAEFCFDGANCLRFPAGDHVSLAAAIRRLAVEPVLRRRLVEGGLTTAHELSLERLVDVLETWHDAAAAGFPDGMPAPRPSPLSPVTP